MEIIQWDAYKFIDKYVDVLEWRTSFLVSNEMETLASDIEEKILKGKEVTFECNSGAESVRVVTPTGRSFVKQIIVDMESNFIIREIDVNNYRIDLMDKDNLETVIYVHRVYEETIH